MYKSVPFDADRDFVPIVLISKTPIVLVASQATGLKRLDALIARAKADPGKLNIGSPGHGTPPTSPPSRCSGSPASSSPTCPIAARRR